MKAYKITQDVNDTYKAGRILVEIDDTVMLLANFTQEQMFVYSQTIKSLIKDGKVEEVNLEDEVWIHPHLYKPIKEKIVNG